jgi:hypothetical protein
MVKEIVIAAYDKSLDWIKEIKSDIKISVYRKGEVLPLNDNEIKISPNKGRCIHTFFNHIYINYDNLADYTFFVQDFPFDHWGNLIFILNSDIEEIKKNASLTIDGYYGYHNNTFGSAWHLQPSQQFGNGGVISCYSNGSPQDLNPNINVDKYWKLLFIESQIPPNMYEFMPGGHFVITKEQIILRSKNFYKQIIDLLLEDENSPWMIERLECYIFNKNYISKL